MKIIPLKYDFCVKEVMENETVRRHFISDVLSIPLRDIKSVRILNPFLWKRYKKQKLGILDIQLELNNDAKINIEIQLKQMHDWKKRSVFYLTKMFTADLRRGEDYEKAKRCIVITILDFEPEDCASADYHNVYMLRNKNGTLYTDVLELHTIELKKKPRREQSSPLDEWHSLFNAETEEELDMLKLGTKNLGIIEAIRELKEISLSDRLRYEHEMRLKAKRDRRAEDKYVYNQGHKAGIEIGKQQGIEIGKSQGIEIGKSQGIEIGEERGIEIGKSQGIEIGKQQSLRIFINYMRKNGLSDEHIIKELMTEYGLSREDAVEAIH